MPIRDIFSKTAKAVSRKKAQKTQKELFNPFAIFAPLRGKSGYCLKDVLFVNYPGFP